MTQDEELKKGEVGYKKSSNNLAKKKKKKKKKEQVRKTYVTLINGREW